MYDYTVAIMGQDYDHECGWSDEHYTAKEVPVDSYEDAVAYCDAITEEQVLEWERRSKCNALDVVIFADEVMESGTYTMEFHIVGEYEWIGTKLNARDVWEVADVRKMEG